MGNFDDLSMAVASFGGNNKVIYDDLEKPSIMVGIPKMKFSDLITGGTQDTRRKGNTVYFKVSKRCSK